MKLYYTKGACSLVPRIIINELNLSCEFESVDLASKKTQSGKDFYAINPKGCVPALETATGEIVTENAVILQYLADTHDALPLLPAIKHKDRYKVLEWLNFVSTELHKGLSPLFSVKLPQDIKDTIIIPLVKTKIDLVNQQLAHHDYIAGPHFTLPDAYLFVMLLWVNHFKLDLKGCPNVSRYLNTLLTRRAIQQSLNEEGLPLNMNA